MSHLLVKLGTILNTIGSLGVGYYTAKHGLLVDFGAFMDAANPTHLAQIGGSLIILAAGLVLRVRDLVLRADDVGKYRKTIREYSAMRQDDQQELMNLRRDKTNMLGMIKETIRPLVHEVLEEEGVYQVPPANPDFPPRGYGPPPRGWEPLTGTPDWYDSENMTLTEGSGKVQPPEPWPDPPPKPVGPENEIVKEHIWPKK